MNPGGAYLTVVEVAQLARCEQKTVRRAIASGQLRAFRPAHRLLIREQDARSWVEGRPAVPLPRSRHPRRGSGQLGSVADLLEIERRAQA